MVMSTTDLNWLMEVVTHEWVHNYLTLRPLGIHYFSSGELRTMNETTANLAGKELGRALIARYYPELLPEPAPVDLPQTTTPLQTEPPAFDFRAEMHATRVKVDEFLATGMIEEAEEFMEDRRQFFWQNGYQIRRLNQAYFAFYGAYADGGGGEAGQDPVGPGSTTRPAAWCHCAAKPIQTRSSSPGRPITRLSSSATWTRSASIGC